MQTKANEIIEELEGTIDKQAAEIAELKAIIRKLKGRGGIKYPLTSLLLIPTLEGKFGCALGSPKKRSDLFLFYLIRGHVGFVRNGDIFPLTE